MEDNINKPYKGLFTDASFSEQPKETYRFALNAVNETTEGEEGLLSNEKGNELCANLPENFIPIGKVYLGNKESVLFLVNKTETISEIALFDNNCNYTILLNDAGLSAQNKLNFKLSNQIDAVYRLRKSSERTIYFSDGVNKPRYFNLDRPNDFKENSEWVISKLNLLKTYQNKPILKDIKVTENGQIAAGSYIFALQYLDEDLNTTEFVDSWGATRIYNNSEMDSFEEIRGSTNIQNGFQDFGLTNKALVLEFENLDQNFPFYRVAIIAFENGSGNVSKVFYSAEKSTRVPFFTYSGSTGLSTGVLEEIQFSRTQIETAAHIEQVENRLILGDIKGKQIDFCGLQFYASQITADCIIKDSILTQLTNGNANPKKEVLFFEGAGYMPGEIYSFGLVYVFKDGTVSPVYHIPGKSPALMEETIFTPGSKPMSKSNASFTENYISNTGSCSNAVGIWGYDSQGVPLEGTPIRHHRFPTRAQLGLPVIEKTESLITTITSTIKVTFTGTIEDPTAWIPITINYDLDSVPQSYTSVIYGAAHNYNGSTEISVSVLTGIVTNIVVSFTPTGDLAETHTNTFLTTTKTIQDTVSKTLGIKFSNILKPHPDIVGFYIVRNERTEENKTILDSAILMPFLEEDYYIAHAHLMPTLSTSERISKEVVCLHNPEFKFLDKEYRNFTEIIKEGEYVLDGNPRVSSSITQDVGAGTSYDPDVHKKKAADYDGYSLHVAVRENKVKFVSTPSASLFNASEIKEVNYLNALSSKIITKDDETKKEIFNVSGDNKIGYIQLKEGSVDISSAVYKKIPYIKLKRTLNAPYSNFSTLPYYKDSVNMHVFNSERETVEIFGGDTYVTPQKIASSIFNNFKLFLRKTKKSAKFYIAAALATVVTIVAAVITVLSWSSATPLTVTATTAAWAGVTALAASAAISMVSSGIKIDTVNKVYFDLYEEGLKNTVEDDFTSIIFDSLNPSKTIADDELQWLGDVVTDVWFESQVNMSLRQGHTFSGMDFLNPLSPRIPKDYENATYPEPDEASPNAYNTYDVGLVSSALTAKGLEVGFRAILTDGDKNALESYFLRKITVTDDENSDGRLYTGFAMAEFYDINKDYLARNIGKFYFTLGLEYDCCTKNAENFPQRFCWSEQSFQEELSDNYRIFLPNNYRDIEGETGPITDLFKIQNSILIHTKEALWQLPAATQERITGQIISYIGTGEFFSQPPRKIMDAEQFSAGSKEKWATLRTKAGIFFVAENEKKIYLFGSQGLQAISDLGQSSWFEKYIPLTAAEQYKKANKRDFPFIGNSSHPFGVGFSAVYDDQEKRILLTKTDFTFSNEVLQYTDFELDYVDGHLRIFLDYEAKILQYEQSGYKYLGIIDHRMKFSKKIISTGFPTIEYIYKDSILLNKPVDLNTSWTISYSLKNNSWVSLHSYLPSFYIQLQEQIYSFNKFSSTIWKHNIQGLYNSFYGEKKPFIIEYVSNSNAIVPRVWDSLKFLTEASKYDLESDNFILSKDITFNKLILYNSRQCSGLLELITKDAQLNQEDFFKNQTRNDNLGTVILSNNEGTWALNDLRDIRVDYTKPIWKKTPQALQENYYIDKVLDESALNLNRDWQELESFRDKYLVIRLIFDTFEDVKLVFNYSIENERRSIK